MVSETVKKQMARYKEAAPGQRARLAHTPKRCSMCRTEKARSEFHNSSCTPDGLMNQCKVCRNTHGAAVTARKARERGERSYADWCNTNEEYLRQFLAEHGVLTEQPTS